MKLHLPSRRRPAGPQRRGVFVIAYLLSIAFRAALTTGIFALIMWLWPSLDLVPSTSSLIAVALAVAGVEVLLRRRPSAVPGDRALVYVGAATFIINWLVTALFDAFGAPHSANTLSLGIICLAGELLSYWRRRRKLAKAGK